MFRAYGYPESGSVMLPIDSGKTWQDITPFNDQRIAYNSIFIDSHDRIFAGGGPTSYTINGGGIYFSTDQGKNWKIKFNTFG